MIKQVIIGLIILTVILYTYFALRKTKTSIPIVPIIPPPHKPVVNDVYMFDGISYSTLPRITADNKARFTIEFDLRTNGQNAFVALFGSASFPPRETFIMALVQNGRVVIMIGGNNVGLKLISTTVVSNGNWHRVVLNRIDDTWNLLIDLNVEATGNKKLNRLTSGLLSIGYTTDSEALKVLLRENMIGLAGCIRNIVINGDQLLYFIPNGIVKKLCNF